MRRRIAVGAAPCNEKILLPLSPSPMPPLRSESVRFLFRICRLQTSYHWHYRLASRRSFTPGLSETRIVPAPLPSPPSTCRNTAKIQQHIQYTYVHLQRTHTPPPHAPCVDRHTSVFSFLTITFSLSVALSIYHPRSFPFFLSRSFLIRHIYYLLSALRSLFCLFVCFYPSSPPSRDAS